MHPAEGVPCPTETPFVVSRGCCGDRRSEMVIQVCSCFINGFSLIGEDVWTPSASRRGPRVGVNERTHAALRLHWERVLVRRGLGDPVSVCMFVYFPKQKPPYRERGRDVIESRSPPSLSLGAPVPRDGPVLGGGLHMHYRPMLLLVFLLRTKCNR